MRTFEPSGCLYPNVRTLNLTPNDIPIYYIKVWFKGVYIARTCFPDILVKSSYKPSRFSMIFFKAKSTVILLQVLVNYTINHFVLLNTPAYHYKFPLYLRKLHQRGLGLEKYKLVGWLVWGLRSHQQLRSFGDWTLV